MYQESRFLRSNKKELIHQLITDKETLIEQLIKNKKNPKASDEIKRIDRFLEDANRKRKLPFDDTRDQQRPRND